MRAYGIRCYGGRDTIERLDIPEPRPGPGEVRIRIRAAGVNPVDYKIREGLLRDRMPSELPIVLGWDAAGVVDAVGDDVTRRRVGDEVCAYCRKGVIHDGTYAEAIVVPESSVALKPKSLSFEQAAAVPLAALTAWQALFDAGGVAAGQTVLIHAAAGGVGGFAVQFAADLGCRVLGTASRANHDYLRSIGVTEAIDYRSGDFRDAVRRLAPDGVDFALDGVGGDVLDNTPALLKPGGRMITIVNGARAAELAAAGLRVGWIFVAPNAAQLAEIGAIIDDGRVKVRLAAALPLDRARDAHKMIESRHTAGKVVLVPGEDPR